MIKLLFLAKKQSHLSYDEFITYLVTIDAPLVERMSGARRYVINAAIPEASFTTPGCDAVEEIWFDSLAAMQEALASKEGRAVVRRSPMFLESRRRQRCCRGVGGEPSLKADPGVVLVAVTVNLPPD